MTDFLGVDLRAHTATLYIGYNAILNVTYSLLDPSIILEVGPLLSNVFDLSLYF